MSTADKPANASSDSAAATVWAVRQGQTASPQQTATAKERKKKIKPKNERRPAAAAVTSTRNVARASISQRSADGYYAELVIMDSGLALRNPQDLLMVGSSGSQTSDGSRIIFENFVLPFEGTVRFKSPNKMNTVIYERVVNFKINEAGRWVVRIDI
ncbi:hypothetical protein [Pontibacter litorisediminis]|uniref:hypothetical protein n=1 Tax=Pontibacter litorisediminis TaxID=1846260 RepID=UPI0023ECEC92|nr:hypothetical protein [Pontibacter litorisediminis]